MPNRAAATVAPDTSSVRRPLRRSISSSRRPPRGPVRTTARRPSPPIPQTTAATPVDSTVDDPSRTSTRQAALSG